MPKSLAPIVLFAYQRPEHTRSVLDALLRNPLAIESDLIVFVDGPKATADETKTDAVCELFDGLHGFKSVEVHRSSVNRGLARSITEGVSAVVEKRGRVIVLEDDIVVSEYFLQYMNDALEVYQHDTNVASIHGYTYPIGSSLPATYFLKGADCWGWATWDRAWAEYNENGSELLARLLRSPGLRDFDFDGSTSYVAMLRDQIRGKNDSWAVRWYASAFLADMYTLYPGRSLVQNIGLDGSGAHCGVSDRYGGLPYDGTISVTRIEVAELPEARAAFTEYFRSARDRDTDAAFRRLVRRASARRVGQRLLRRFAPAIPPASTHK